MQPEQLLPLIRDLGVTGVTLLVILLRLEPKLDGVIRSVERLTDAVQLHAVTRAHDGRHTQEDKGRR